jgi:hypothetical protein
MMNISFLGAAGTVTGSRHLLEFSDKRILVDCGLFHVPLSHHHWHCVTALLSASGLILKDMMHSDIAAGVACLYVAAGKQSPAINNTRTMMIQKDVK